MHFRKYLIPMAMILCALSGSRLTAQNLKVVSVSGGEQSSLVVAENNEVFSAGAVLGRSGNSYFFDRVFDGEMNTATELLENIIGAGAGWVHALALTSGGQTVAWGDNSNGELGNGDQYGTTQPAPVWVHAGAQNPSLPDSNLCNIIQVAAGRSGAHSLAFESGSGLCFAWGSNNMGQCGDNSITNRIRPVKVLAGQQNPSHPSDPNYPLQNIIAVSAGEEHSMALASDGSVYTFGENSSNTPSQRGAGKLGIGDANSNTYRTTPQKVHGVNNVDFLADINSISAGWDHCMALQKYVVGSLTYKGRVYCWGNNDYGYYSGGGRLGDGNSTGISATPVFVKAGEQNPDNPTGTYLEGIVAIGAGEGHSMALDANGFVLCWGDNNHGQLGNGTTDDSATPVYVQLEDGSRLRYITKISAGYWHNLAIDTNGVLYVWGDGLEGQLGLGRVTYQPYAVPIEFFYPSDFNRDGMVNFIDYAIFAKAWKTQPSDANWNPLCDLADDNNININDLAWFAKDWPFSSANQQSQMGGGGMGGMGAELQTEPEALATGLSEEPSMMEGLLPLIYMTCDTNMPEPNQEVTVYVHSDTPLYIMEILASITGDANITSAMSPADCNQYGWEPSWQIDPYIDDPNGWVYFGGIVWPGETSGMVGYFKFIYHSGQVAVSIEDGGCTFGTNCEPVPFSTDTLIFGSDPNE